jgi:hypothetical protein
VLVGTKETRNRLSELQDGTYLNIDMRVELSAPTTSLLRFLANSVTPGPGGSDGNKRNVHHHLLSSPSAQQLYAPRPSHHLTLFWLFFVGRMLFTRVWLTLLIRIVSLAKCLPQLAHLNTTSSHKHHAWLRRTRSGRHGVRRDGLLCTRSSNEETQGKNVAHFLRCGRISLSAQYVACFHHDWIPLPAHTSLHLLHRCSPKCLLARLSSPSLSLSIDLSFTCGHSCASARADLMMSCDLDGQYRDILRGMLAEEIVIKIWCVHCRALPHNC